MARFKRFMCNFGVLLTVFSVGATLCAAAVWLGMRAAFHLGVTPEAYPLFGIVGLLILVVCTLAWIWSA